MNMGDSTINYRGVGLISVGVEKQVEANSKTEITTTMGINFSSGNDFTISVPMVGGGDRKIMPDSMDELEAAAKKMISGDTVSNLDAILSGGNGKANFVVKEGGKKVGEIDPKAMLKAIADYRAAHK